MSPCLAIPTSCRSSLSTVPHELILGAQGVPAQCRYRRLASRVETPVLNTRTSASPLR